MYSTQLKDTNTITWHNLHFLLEHHCNETLTTIEKIIIEQEAFSNDRKSLQEFKSEVMSTIKTIKAMESVIKHHRFIGKRA